MGTAGSLSVPRRDHAFDCAPLPKPPPPSAAFCGICGCTESVQGRRESGRARHARIAIAPAEQGRAELREPVGRPAGLRRVRQRLRRWDDVQQRHVRVPRGVLRLPWPVRGHQVGCRQLRRVRQGVPGWRGVLRRGVRVRRGTAPVRDRLCGRGHGPVELRRLRHRVRVRPGVQHRRVHGHLCRAQDRLRQVVHRPHQRSDELRRVRLGLPRERQLSGRQVPVPGRRDPVPGTVRRCDQRSDELRRLRQPLQHSSAVRRGPLHLHAGNDELCRPVLRTAWRCSGLLLSSSAPTACSGTPGPTRSLLSPPGRGAPRMLWMP